MVEFEASDTKLATAERRRQRGDAQWAETIRTTREAVSNHLKIYEKTKNI